jgi:hypothetical protein
MGLSAVVAILGLGLGLAGTGRLGGGTELQQRALVLANQTFTLSAVGPGQYAWSLEDSGSAVGPGIVSEKVIRFDQSDLVELTLEEGVQSGVVVAAGAIVARVKTPRNERKRLQLEASKEALSQNKALLAAGARPEEVQQASRNRDLAVARREQNRAELDRVRGLVEQAAASEAELQALELTDKVLAQEIAVAEAAIQVARSSARPEALAALDAQIRAAESGLAEIEAVQSQDELTSPIGGVVSLGGSIDGTTLLRVQDVASVYVRMPVPMVDRPRIQTGSAVQFDTAAQPGRAFSGVVTDVSASASTLNGYQVFWATAKVENRDGALRPGMMGDVRVELQGGGTWSAIWRRVTGGA